MSDQLAEIVGRLLPIANKIGWYVDDLRGQDRDVSTRLQVVRHFDDEGGEDDDALAVVVGDRTLHRLGGQHQLLGWHVDATIIDFLLRTRAELDVDECG